mgnify:CR=1 FL=1
MVECSICHKHIDEKVALVNTDKDGNKRVICQECFKQEAGVDYETFAYRKENAKQISIAVIICLVMTIYAFVEKGPLYGAFNCTYIFLFGKDKIIKNISNIIMR